MCVCVGGGGGGVCVAGRCVSRGGGGGVAGGGVGISGGGVGVVGEVWVSRSAVLSFFLNPFRTTP